MRAKAFTLVELLVSVAVLALLMAILLPAVNAAREAARKSHCQSNLRTMTVATAAFESATGGLPSGGWGYRWVGDPDRGSGRDQPGGWIYSLLPFLEEQSLHDLGHHLPRAAKLAASAQRIGTPLSVMQCPSRREPQAYPTWCETCSFPFGSAPVSRVARSDYAANAGDHRWPWSAEGPPTLKQGDLMSARNLWPETLGQLNGVIFFRSHVRIAEITDGTSKTYLVGEKYVPSDQYASGRDWADNESMYCGFNNDTHRSTHLRWNPMGDRQNVSHTGAFGSAHPQVFHMAMCDGSVHALRFSIDASIHRSAGVRAELP